MTHTDRPLVTFALFAYNQEEYIREAVEGAFSQTYEPLEIILSDDCSSDRTFEIMQEMAAEYQGPHKVMTRQSNKNMGVLSHVLSVSRAAKGKIAIVAAGDDISLPERTECAVEFFRSEDIFAFSSEDLIIDEFGNETRWDQSRSERREAWYTESQTWVHGATAAYRTSFLNEIPIPKEHIFFEDMFFSDLLKILGKSSARCKKPLVKYRYHFHNLSGRRSKQNDIENIEARAIERWKRAYDAKAFAVDFVRGNSHILGDKPTKAYKNIDGEMNYLFLISNWKHNGLASKVKLLYYGIRFGSPQASFSRIFGEYIFKYTRRFGSSGKRV